MYHVGLVVWTMEVHSQEVTWYIIFIVGLVESNGSLPPGL